MAIWKQPITLDILAAISRKTAVEWVGIEFLEIGPDHLTGRVPVDERTRQPFGILHGGISVVLAETLGSCAAGFAVPEGHSAVGIEINANHLKSVSRGWVTGVARAVHLGRTTQVWSIEMRDDAGDLTCVSRLTLAVLAPRAK
ncbi:hotdog fold thioesterase [Mesoterricola silvestris]|uniref:Esterase n=1 Tax=Mesoterricola silvestris TaxID=2927979 RepID=A0AA48GTH6_9BACT|nr:hotdog fold thioesterase [Mesoterricola silvestris]BDU73742.1 esterase [Mesoterricola silvestris]